MGGFRGTSTYDKVSAIVMISVSQWQQNSVPQIQGVFFYWSPQKSLSMELALPPQFQTGPPPTQNVIKFVKELQYNT